MIHKEDRQPFTVFHVMCVLSACLLLSAVAWIIGVTAVYHLMHLLTP